MEGNPMESQGMSSQDSQASSAGESRSSTEDPRPSVLRPQAMPTAEVPSMTPRLREQALPEKGDDRFFDRWAVDKARDLGARAVRRPALEKLREAVSAFAEWRSLRHGPAVERENMADRSLVASTPAKIVKAKEEAERLSASADEAKEKADRHEAQVQEAAEEISSLRPALRGTEWDILILLLANVVVFVVDIFIIHAALGRIPGNEQEYWLTAIVMGAGAVVVGDVLGWIAGVGAIRKDGSIGRPGKPAIAAIAGLLILSVWFFVKLGDFREFAIVAEAKSNGVLLEDPTFFTSAQILFLLAAAVVCFSYVARRNGRELLRWHQDLRDELDGYRTEVKSLRRLAEQARLTAAEAPVLCMQAEERIAARERIAKGAAEHDRKQGAYLKTLVVSEYMKERADVESGVRYWQFEQPGQASGSTILLRLAPAVVGTLAAGGIAFWVVGSLFAAIASAAIVALAFFVAGGRDGSDEEEIALESQRQQKYIAQLVASARKGGERAGDIERLVPFPPPAPDPAPQTPPETNGGSDRRRHMTRAERAKMKKTTIVYRDNG